MADSPDDPISSPVDIQKFTDEALIDLVLGRPGVAAHVLSSLGGLAHLPRLSTTALTERFGVTLDEATRLIAAFELGHRRQVALANIPAFPGSRDVVAWAQPRIGHLVHEEVWLIALDLQNRSRGERMLSRGGTLGAAIRSSDVLRAGLELAASAIILVHNHPGGDPTPSADDVQFTERILEAADVVGVPLVDHVIVTASDAFSALVKRRWVVFKPPQ